MIEPRSFCLFANCEIVYEGRATSTLAKGNYLILFKNDSSVSIHGGDNIIARNYMGSNSVFAVDGNRLMFSRRKETITIIIHDMITINYLDDWSVDKIKMCRTEKELVAKIYNNWAVIFPDYIFETIETEYPTSLGPIDLIGISEKLFVVVEVKRKNGSLKDVTQLRRYVEAMENKDKEVRGYLAAPAISKNAMKYLKKHNLEYMLVNFD